MDLFPMAIFYDFYRNEVRSNEVEKEEAQLAAPLGENRPIRKCYAFAGFSPRVKPGAGRSSGRTTLGSALGAACGGGVGGVRGFSGSGLFSIKSFTSLASITSRSSSASAMRSRVSRFADRRALARS